MRRFFPKSLSGQIALIVAVALFVAQAINFGLLLNERRGARFGQVIFPAVARITDASERFDQGGGREDDGYIADRRTRVQLRNANPIDDKAKRRPDVEEGIAKGLQDAGFATKAVVVTIRPIDPSQIDRRHYDPARADRMRRFGAEAWIAVQRGDGKWLSLSTGWPRTEKAVIWQLIAQTGILYICVLVPILWAGRRIARPLRNLAVATQSFTPGDSEPVEERGPSDVRAVISAHNALSLRVNAMLDEKDRMLGAIGHDLRTPLAALRVRIESVEDDEDRNRMADTIDEMNRTLDDILSLARLGRPSEPPTEVDVAALIDAVVEDFHDLDQPVSFDEETPRLTMKLRPNLMRRAVRNLIENAVKYGHGAEVKLIPGDKSVSIDVADRGPGIPEDKIASVFDPFTRLETSRNRETGGIGLGLALAQAIVRDAGGQIVLANREGGGLCATIRLPRA